MATSKTTCAPIEPKLNKHEIKTRETRELLLRAAETIFVRDGYEGADLAEIASLAGRTKGAIYAQFKSKEDIFFALIAEHRTRFRAQSHAAFRQCTTAESRVAALRKLSQNFIEDKAWALLLLEFKLYAIRHPESKERYQTFFQGIRVHDEETRLNELFGSPGKGRKSLSRAASVHSLQPVLSALALEAQFTPELFTDETVHKVLLRIFDALLQST